MPIPAEVPPIPAAVLTGPDRFELPAIEELGKGALADPSSPDYRPWRVTGRRSAEWAMTKLAETLEALAPIRERHAEWRKALAKLETEETTGLAQRARFFSAVLKDYALAVRAGEIEGETLDGARLRLANGHVQTVGQAPRIVIEDQVALVKWVRENIEGADKLIAVEEHVPHAALEPFAILAEVPLAVLLSCSHEADTVDLADPDTGELLPPPVVTVGLGVICPTCAAPALVGRILTSTPAVLDADGVPIPGLRAVVGEVSATPYPGGKKAPGI